MIKLSNYRVEYSGIYILVSTKEPHKFVQQTIIIDMYPTTQIVSSMIHHCKLTQIGETQLPGKS